MGVRLMYRFAMVLMAAEPRGERSSQVNGSRLKVKGWGVMQFLRIADIFKFF